MPKLTVGLTQMKISDDQKVYPRSARFRASVRGSEEVLNMPNRIRTELVPHKVNYGK